MLLPYAPSQTPGWTHICLDNSSKISNARKSLKIWNLNSSTAIILPNSISLASIRRIERYVGIKRYFILTCICIHVIVVTSHSISPYSNKGLPSLQTGHMMQDCEWCRKNMDGCEKLRSGKHRRNPAVYASARSRAHRQSWLIIYFPLATKTSTSLTFIAINIHHPTLQVPASTSPTDRPTIPCQLPVRRSRSGDSPVLFKTCR